MNRRSLILRVATAVVGIPVLVGAAWLGGWWWVAVLMALGAIAAVEFIRLTPAINGFAFLPVAVLLVVLLAAVVDDLAATWLAAGGLLVLLVGGVLPPVLGGDPHRAGWLARPGAGMIVGWAYLGVSLGVLARWGFQDGFAVVLWFFLVIWANDIAAYFFGSLVGRHKLAPGLSPGKTWEGAVAGVGLGTLLGWIAAAALPISSVQAVIAGVIVAASSQLGDLFESAMKRRAGVKDSGVLFPGHGGVLDRFDGVFAAAPLAYLLLRWWAR